MKRNKGFTLVELLVVIAIITILASIVVPRVTDWLSRSRMAKAVSEIRNADLALTKMLADTSRKHFGQFFGNTNGQSNLALAITAAYTDLLNDYPQLEAAAMAYQQYNTVFYELLRRGRDAGDGTGTIKIYGRDLVPAGEPDGIPDNWVYDLEIQASIKKRLGTSYIELGKDAWGETGYQFYAGPCPRVSSPNSLTWEERWRVMPFRCYRGEGYSYTNAAYQEAQVDLPGNPPPDDRPGFPGPADFPVYIWSMGEDMVSNQLINGENGYDDINNWDNAGGWQEFY